jgi:hypothetical protein
VVGMEHRSRRRPWRLAAASAALLLALGACGGDDASTVEQGVEHGATGHPSDTTSVTTGETTGAGEPLVLEAPADAGTGRCLPPSADLLSDAAVAFDGTVRGIAGRLVDLDVSRWYRGGPADVVTVRAQPGSLQALIDAVAFEEGGRFLVAADDAGMLYVCGLSAPWNEDLAALYAEAFGG